jgi:tetratricopeptide (TPR) repeat protein
MNRFNRRRRQRNFFLGNLYMNPSVQYLTTIVSAIALAGFVFSGFLLFRFTDEEDLINRGKMQLAEGKVAWACQTFQTLVTHHRDSYEGHLLLGQAYLQLDERRKAEQEFELAASLKNGSKDNAPAIALSKVAVAQGDYTRAEGILKKVYERNRKDPNVRQAMFELYEQWGNTLYEAPQKDYPAIVEKYELSLQFVNNYQAQHGIEDKLLDAIHSYTDRLIAMKDYNQAARLLKLSLRFKYLPETLIQIAEVYGQMDKLDESIDWYRRAFDASPNVVGLRLTNVLVQKGQMLAKADQKEEAQKYFDEADQVSKQAQIPLDNLYPVGVSRIKVDANMDEATGEIAPHIRLRLSNDSSRDLNFLAVKAEFLSGTDKLVEIREVAASPDKPFPMRDNRPWLERNIRIVELEPKDKMNIHALKDGKITVKISIAYQDGGDAVWKLKSIQEITVRNNTAQQQNTPGAEPV